MNKNYYYKRLLKEAQEYYSTNVQREEVTKSELRVRAAGTIALFLGIEAALALKARKNKYYAQCKKMGLSARYSLFGSRRAMYDLCVARANYLYEKDKIIALKKDGPTKCASHSNPKECRKKLQLTLKNAEKKLQKKKARWEKLKNKLDKKIEKK